MAGTGGMKRMHKPCGYAPHLALSAYLLSNKAELDWVS
jgi:hypothetical protein